MLNETDAFETLDYIKDFINDCYDKKDSIKPSDEKRNLPSPFDVYEILPRLNLVNAVNQLVWHLLQN